MTIDEALKVIDLNIDKLNGSMQMAVRTLLQDKTIFYGGYEQGFNAGCNHALVTLVNGQVKAEVVCINSSFNDLKMDTEEFRKATSVFKEGDKVKILIIKEEGK